LRHISSAELTEWAAYLKRDDERQQKAAAAKK
jgi:hypothetical protein